MDTQNIEITRGYEVLPDNSIRFGIRVDNKSTTAISDVEIILDYSEPLFSLETERIQKLGNIPPSVARTAKFLLKPLSCIHNESIGGTVLYKDSEWQMHMEPVRKKEIHCICPFLKGKPLKHSEFVELVSKGVSIETGMSFKGIKTDKLVSFLTQTCKNRLYKVDEYSTDEERILYFAAESIGEKKLYLLTVVVTEKDDMIQILFKATATEDHGLNGFLNEIVSDLKNLVLAVKSAQQIGIIKKEQVINIIDSVVQRTNFNVDDSVSLNVKDSVLQGSQINTNTQKRFLEVPVQEAVGNSQSSQNKISDIRRTNLGTATLENNQKRVLGIPVQESASNSQSSQNKTRDVGRSTLGKSDLQSKSSKKSTSVTYVYASVLFVFVIFASFIPFIPYSYTVSEPYTTTETYYESEPYETTKTETYTEAIPQKIAVQESEGLFSGSFNANYKEASSYVNLTNKQNSKVSITLQKTAGPSYTVFFAPYKNCILKDGYKIIGVWGSNSVAETINDEYYEFEFVPEISDRYCLVVISSNAAEPVKIVYKGTFTYTTAETTYSTIEKTRIVPVVKYQSVAKTRQVQKTRTVTKETHISVFEMLSKS